MKEITQVWVLGVGWYLELDDLVLQTFSAKIGAKLDVLPFFFPSYVVCMILVTRPSIEPLSPAVKAMSPSCWTPRHIPEWSAFLKC